MKRKTDILHILPHAGGGVGTVLRAILTIDSSKECPYRHTVASLDYLNKVTQNHCDKLGVPWIDEVSKKRRKNLNTLLIGADIVLIHWWNHPLLMRLLFEGLPSTRLILWSHVNGFFPPQAFFSELFNLPDRFVFSSKVSFMAPTVQRLPEKLQSELMVICSSLGIPEGSENLCRKSGLFKAGYIGTVEPIKMHADFLDICAQAAIPSPIIVAGGPAYVNLQRMAEAMNISESFSILGPIRNPYTLFKQLHVLAYPLNPRHYGTGEQVLIEAMAFGAVPVVLSNPTEKAIVSHGRTGLVAENALEFSKALRWLMENPDERDSLAVEGHRFVMEECGIERTINAFHDLFGEISNFPKRSRKLRLAPIAGVKYGSPSHLFLVSLGDTKEQVISKRALHECKANILLNDFKSKTRGTAFHYRDLLGNDVELEAVCNSIMA